MKILLVTGRFPQRSETFIYRKAVALARRGHEVTVLARSRGDWGLYPEPLPPSLTVIDMPPDLARGSPTSFARSLLPLAEAIAEPGQLRQLAKLARAHPPSARTFARHLPFVGRAADVIHFEFLGLAALYPLAGPLLGIPTIASCRGQDVHLLAIKQGAAHASQLAALRHASALHCVSRELASAVESLTGRKEGVWVNHGAVDVAAIQPQQRVRADGSPLQLLIAGRLVWVKGLDYLLAALAQLVRRGVSFRARILGEGELQTVLRFSIDDLGLKDHVSLVGGVTSAQVLDELGHTDLFVLSSLEEGISNGVLEAMASGVPVVTTRAGGMVEAVTDGVEGFVVPIRDPAALADAIARVAADEQLRARMGLAARDRAVRCFSIERQIDTFEKIYKSVAGAA